MARVCGSVGIERVIAEELKIRIRALCLSICILIRLSASLFDLLFFWLPSSIDSVAHSVPSLSWPSLRELWRTRAQKHRKLVRPHG